MEEDRVILLQRVQTDETDDTHRTAQHKKKGRRDTYEDEEESSGGLASLSATEARATADTTPAIAYVAAIIAASGGLLFGYDIGVISGAKHTMQSELKLTCKQVGDVVAILPAGALLASLVGGALIDKCGRKWTIVANSLIFTFGAIVIALSQDISVILAGRFALGFAVALSAIAECIYISEIALPEKRGMLVSLNELAIALGILMAYLVNYIFSDLYNGWRFMFGLSAGAAIIQAAAMSFMPKTPQYLMICKREAEAEKVLKTFRLSRNVRQTLADIRLSLADEADRSSCAALLSADRMPFRLLVGFGCVFFQQFSGQPNLVYYANEIFRQFGFCNGLSSVLATVGLGLMKVVSTVASLLLVDRIGRRKALLSGVAIMAASIGLLAIFAAYQEDLSGIEMQETCHDLKSATSPSSNRTPSTNELSVEHDIFLPWPSKNVSAEATTNDSGFHIEFTSVDSCPVSESSTAFRYAAFAALVIFVSAYSFSFGPVTWILLSEIFPASTKGRAMALANAGNWLGNVIVSGTFLQATSALTLSGVFFCYGFVCVTAIVFIAAFVPETRHRTLEQISKDMKNKNPRTLVHENIAACFCCLPKKNVMRTTETYSKLRTSEEESPTFVI